MRSISICDCRRFSSSRMAAAFSKSWLFMASAFSAFSLSRADCCSLRSSGGV